MVYAALSSRSSQESRLGSNRIEYPTALSDIAYELLLAKENPLTHLDELAAQKYSEALDVYMAAKDVWEISDKLKECEARTSDSKFCLSLHGASAASPNKCQPDHRVRRRGADGLASCKTKGGSG
jgi:hypothetical protein